MNEKKLELIDILKSMLKEREEEIDKSNSFTNSYTNLNNFIQSLEEDFLNITNIGKFELLFTEEEIKFTKEEIKFIDEVIRVVNAYKENEFVKINSLLIENIKSNSLYQSIIKKITEQRIRIQEKIYIENQQKSKITELEKIINHIESLEQTQYITEIEEINNYLYNDVKIDFYNKIKISRLIIEYNIMVGKANKYLYEEEISTMKTSNMLEEEDLITLFKKYGYNFILLNEEIKQSIKEQGNLEEIKNVFEFFEKYNIRFNEQKEEDKVYFNILYKSNLNILTNIEQISLKNKIEITDLLDKTPSIFMKKNKEKNAVSRRKTDIDIIEQKNRTTDFVITGSFEDFTKNIELFESLGYDINKIYERCSSILVESNKKIVNNIESLKKYGIDIKSNPKSIKLSGLKGNDVLFTIDQFIEQEELEYLLQNTSRLMISPEHAMFKRIYEIKKHNKENTDNKIYYKNISQNGRITFKSFVTSSKLDMITNSKENQPIKPIIFNEEIQDKFEEIIKNTQDDELEYSMINIPIIRKLEDNYRTSNLTYSIAGKTFSRYKVLRIYSKLYLIRNIDYDDLLLYCLTYNSILTQKEFEEVKKELMPRKRGLQ